MTSCSNNFAANARHQFTVQKKTYTNTDYGQDISWSDVVTLNGVVEPMKGREVYMSEQHQSRVTHKFIIRYHESLKNTAEVGDYRIVFDGREFPIEYIANLHQDMKNYGQAYQRIEAVDNGPVTE